MPATAAIDNETLDHLLSVVDDSRNVKCVPSIWKRNSCMFRKGSPGGVKCGNRSHQNSDRERGAHESIVRGADRGLARLVCRRRLRARAEPRVLAARRGAPEG